MFREFLAVWASDYLRLGIYPSVEREQEEIIVRRRTEAVDELKQKANDNHARVEARKIDNGVKLQVINNQKFTRTQFDPARSICILAANRGVDKALTVHAKSVLE